MPVARLLLVALAYYVSGRLGLLLAVPPGYATAVWPPSGIALAAVLHVGRAAWPGVWLGSFCVNLSTSPAGADMEALVKSAVLAAVIAVGAAAQAAVGAWLVRRWVGYPTALAREREVFRLLLAAGPASCLINSAWGVGVLAVAGLVPWANAPFNWLTWWVGDTIGVLIFTPAMLVFTSPPSALWRHRRLTLLLPLVVTFALSVALFVSSKRWEAERQRAAFEQRAAAASSAFAEKLGGYLEVLNALERFFASSSGVTRAEFQSFVSGALRRFPGIRALEWLPRVPAPERVAWERAAQAAWPQFQFTEQGTGGRLLRAGERAEYFPVYFLEPFVGNETAAGYDVASEPARRVALEQARDTGRMTVTPWIKLVFAPPHNTGVLVLVPVYERDVPADASVEQRRQRLRGYVMGVFTLAEMMRASLGEDTGRGLELRLRDQQAGAAQPEIIVAAREQNAIAATLWEGSTWSSRHPVGGRTWVLEARPDEQFLAATRGWQSWLVLAGSLLFTSLLGSLLLVVTGRTGSIEEIVTERTAALHESNQRLAREVAQRDALDERLRQMNETLEQRVAERTRALKSSEQAALNMMADAQAASRAASESARALQDSEERIRTSLREKEVLLQEIHHRVKNNLQVVSSLLNLQAEHIQHPETLRAFAESRARIQSMALVHEKIYRDASLARLDFSDYLRELTAQLFQSYNVRPEHITLRLELMPVAFGLDTAIPCALIVNELVSNALKYAFPPGHPGEIRVRLRSEDGNCVQLEVADNGVGLPAGFDEHQSQSLGLRLVRMLTQQLHGQLHLTSEAGVRYSLVFAPHLSDTTRHTL